MVIYLYPPYLYYTRPIPITRCVSLPASIYFAINLSLVNEGNLKLVEKKFSWPCPTPPALASSFLNGLSIWLWQSWSFWPPLPELVIHFVLTNPHRRLNSRPVAVTPKSQKCPFLRRKTHMVSSSCSVVLGPGWSFDLIGSSARHRCVLSVDMGSWWCCVCPLLTISLASTLKFRVLGPKKFRKNGSSAILPKSGGTIFQWKYERIEGFNWSLCPHSVQP